MPYVVTTTRLDLKLHGDYADRQAVATLEEARAALAEHIGPRLEDNTDPSIVAIANTDESGGTVGPLPDGTVIEVEWVDWLDLAAQAKPTEWATDRVWGAPNAEILDAFNAREATR